MSVQTEINRITTRRDQSFTAVTSKGVTVPQGSTLDDLPGLIAQIQPKINRNLLDNAYFVGGGSQLGDGVFPINQRGQTTYSGTGYGVDRWKADLSGAVTINTDSISFLQAHNYDRFCQVINVPPDLPITFTAIVRGGNSGRITVWDHTRNGSFGNARFKGELSGWTLLTLTTTISSTYIQDVFEVRIQGTTSANDEIKAIQIKAAKLELGSEQTLAHNEGTEENPVWVLNEVPDYGEELRKCQRYYQLFRTESLRPTYGEDCRPTMATEQPTKGTLTKGGVTYYTLSSES